MAKHYISPRWSNELLDCSMPMTFDTYNKCSFNCLYCFSYYQKSHNARKKNYQEAPLQWVDIKLIKRMFLGSSKTQFDDFIKDKVVMQWGGLAEPFDNYEKQNGKTLELLKFFDEIDYPLSFSTKATWFVYDKRYINLIKKHAHNWHFKFSIINLDKEKAKNMEVGVDSPQDRIKAIKVLADLGLHITLRLRPFIIGYSNINQEHLELIKLARKAGADSISTEFFCLEQRADSRLKARYEQMSKIIGFDILNFYRLHSIKRGYLRLNYTIKSKYVNEMKDLCDKIGMRFYVSDAHHKDKCSNGSCCGLPCSFNYSRGQFTEALCIAKEKGKVRFSDINKGMGTFKKILWRKACGLNTKGNEWRNKAGELTLYQFIRNKWNTPNDPNSPYKYFQGALVPIGIDKKKDIIYKYQNKDNDNKASN